MLDSLDDFERWGNDGDCAYVFPRGYRRERWSYQRVAGVAYQFARELEARNIAKGDAVPVLLNDQHSFENTGSTDLEFMIVGIAREKGKLD